MKTFSQFIKEAYVLLERSKPKFRGYRTPEEIAEVQEIRRKQKEISLPRRIPTQIPSQPRPKRPTFGSKEELLAHYGGKLPPDYTTYVPRGRPNEWSIQTKEEKKISSQNRRARTFPLTRDDFYEHAKRNFFGHPLTPRQLANMAYRLERARIKELENERDRRKEEDGIDYELDHLQPISQERRRKDLRNRWYALAPSHSSVNLEVKPPDINQEKSDTPPKRGEPGYGLTYGGAISHIFKEVLASLKNRDSKIDDVSANPSAVTRETTSNRGRGSRPTTTRRVTTPNGGGSPTTRRRRVTTPNRSNYEQMTLSGL